MSRMLQLIQNQIRKDLRRLWPFVLAWVLILIVDVVLDKLAGTGTLTQKARSMLVIDLGLLQSFFTFVLPALVVLEEPLVGDRAFWITRPLPRPVLVISKVLFSLAFVTLPAVAANLLDLLGREIGPESMWAAIGWGLVMHFKDVAIAMALASFAADLRGFAFAFVVYRLGLLMGGDVPREIFSSLFSLEPSYGPHYYRVHSAFAVIGCFAVFAHQAFTRRVRRSLALILAVFFGLGLLGFLPLSAIFEPRADEELTELHPISLENDELLEGIYRENRDRLVVAGVFDVRGRRPGYHVELRALEAKLESADGDTLSWREETTRWFGGRESLASTLGAPLSAIEDLSWWQPGSIYFLELSKEDLERSREKPGRLRLEFRLAAMKYELLGVLPLEEGHAIERGFERFWIEKIAFSPKLVELWTKSRFLYDPRAKKHPFERPYLFLRHRKTGEILFANPEGPGGGTYGEPLSVLTKTASLEKQWKLWQMLPDGPRGPDPDWIRESELLVVSEVFLGSFEKTLIVDDYRLPTSWLHDLE